MHQSVDQLAAAIAPILAPYPAIEAAYLFGSRARCNAGPESDLDLGLVGESKSLQALKLDLLADLTAAGFDRIDLVDLDDADTVLRFEAISPNCLLYAREGFDHGSYFSRCLREYFDFQPYLQIQREALKARLLNGQR